MLALAFRSAYVNIIAKVNFSYMLVYVTATFRRESLWVN